MPYECPMCDECPCTCFEIKNITVNDLECHVDISLKDLNNILGMRSKTSREMTERLRMTKRLINLYRAANRACTTSEPEDFDDLLIKVDEVHIDEY